MSRAEDLRRIEAALSAAGEILAGFSPGRVEHRTKAGGSPVTEADLAIDAALRTSLPRPGEGWLSEESEDDPERLECERVWIVDPLDGTLEFVAGIPEWCVSVGLVESGRPVAGGLLAPEAGLTLIGCVERGVKLNGEPCKVRDTLSLSGAEILASRSETARGEWERFAEAPFSVRPTGSVAYKLGQVAAGLADATWTLVGKHEWDVAAGVALVLAAGGEVRTPDGARPRFNRRNPVLPGLITAAPGLIEPIRELLGLA